MSDTHPHYSYLANLYFFIFSSEVLLGYLQMFFDKSVQALGCEHKRDLLLMCSQCYEVSMLEYPLLLAFHYCACSVNRTVY